MKTIEVAILDRDTAGAYKAFIQFDTVDEFMKAVDEEIDGTGFRKCYLDFDTSEFSEGEIKALKEEDFI